jgi:transposase
MAPPAVVYVFAEDRKGERATDLFAGFSGILQVDGLCGPTAAEKCGAVG